MNVCTSPVVTYYLEMNSPSAIRGKGRPDGLVLSECRRRQFQFNRFLYQFIGEKWCWTDKLSWTDEQWRAYAADENLRTWVAYHEGAIAGYFELFRRGEEVEIIYFGLAEQFIGKGMGGYLLTAALEAAWSWQGARRVWVHTCSLDHPGALQNYQARGMQVYLEETV